MALPASRLRSGVVFRRAERLLTCARMTYPFAARALGGLVFLASALAAACGSSSSGGLSPGCLGSPNASCSSYPEGTQCPGGSYCTPCGDRQFTFAPGNCTCHVGQWSCAPASTMCAGPPGPGTYSDSACTMPYPTDGGVEGSLDGSSGADGTTDASTDANAGPVCGQQNDAGMEQAGPCGGGETCCSGGAAGHYFCFFTDGGPCPAVP
jgi:hypothetical protein